MAKPGWTLSVRAVEVTSEEDDYPIESALLSRETRGSFSGSHSLPSSTATCLVAGLEKKSRLSQG